MDVDELKSTKSFLCERIKALTSETNRLQQEFMQAREKLAKAQSQYCEIDRQLAMVDGRFHKVEVKHKQPEQKLTVDAILRLAKELGIKVS